MLAGNLFVILTVAAGVLVDASVLNKRLTQSKLDQFTGTYCDDHGTDGSQNKIYSNINIPSGSCIDIDGKTHTIFLARGTGLVYRRKMTAYAQTGCPANMRIEEFHEHDSGSACMSVDTQMLGIPGSDINQGRIMSVRFDKF